MRYILIVAAAASACTGGVREYKVSRRDPDVEFELERERIWNLNAELGLATALYAPVCR